MITGQFRDKNNILYTVNIGADANIVIGDQNSGASIKFTGDPVEINCDIEDTFQHVIKQSASITLKTQNYLGGVLFGNNPRSITVEILKGNTCIFSGYVEQNTYSQPFNRIWDEFTINCVDSLSTLQFYKYKNMNNNEYDMHKSLANSVTFRDIINNCLTDVMNGGLFYDLSKGVSSDRLDSVFDDLKLNELTILGEDFSDVWDSEECLKQLLQYLNLHIIQVGRDYYIFDWNTIKAGNTSWIDLLTGNPHAIQHSVVDIVSDSHATSNASLSVADVYSTVQVECDLQSQDTVIESPLDDSYLTSHWSGKQLYMQEFISEGEGHNAQDAFAAMLRGEPTDYSEAKVIEWYFQVIESANWRLYIDGSHLLESIYAKSGDRYINQHAVAQYVQQHYFVPGLFRFGSIERKAEATDNSPVNKISLDPYLYISVNGNENHSENGHLPSDSTLQNRIEQAPHSMIEYVGNTSGGSFSPSDDKTVNYLVFSGKVLLQARQWETDRYAYVKNWADRISSTPSHEPYTAGSVDGYWHDTVPSEHNGDGRYYTRKFYQATHPTDAATVLPGVNLMPWPKDKGNRTLQYNYSADGDGTDKYSKVDILECELIIGNKRCVEIDKDMYGNSRFVWVDVESGVNQTYVDENGQTQTYLKKTISLGINPKIGDYLIGDEFDIQNTVDYTMNLSDAEGTAIPIKQSDALTGAVVFRILGPVNNTWNDITRRHPTAFRHTKWYDNTKFLLACCENIIIKDFECKVYSDNGGNTIDADNDLIYMSDEQRAFFKRKDDIKFNIITQLSSDECYKKGIQNGVNINAVTNAITNLPLEKLYNATTGELAKAEEHYVDQYYTAYSRARLIYETDLHDDNTISIFNHYYSTGLGKTFFVQALSRSLKFNIASLKLKEI